jgi:ParB-like chromosome segregation protein Spo0J
MNQGMIVQKIPVSEINPAKYNPRKDLKPGDPAYEKLKRSMTEFGYVEPIIWQSKRYLQPRYLL